MIDTRALGFAVVLAALGTAQAGWNRLPSAETRFVDLASPAMPGTEVASSTGLGNAGSLVGSSLTEGVTVAAGKSSAVIQLGGHENIRSVAFTNDGVDGRITIAGSADNSDWSVLGSTVFSSSERVVQLSFAATAKYVRVSFESAKGGTIRSFKVFGSSTDKDYHLLPKDPGEGGSSVNLASAVGGAQAVYAFPTPTNVGELNHSHNVFKFPKSRDKNRTIVYELGVPRAIKYFAATYSRRPVRVEVFAFESLPEKKDWRGKLGFDPSVFESAKPVAVGEDLAGAGQIKIIPEKPVTAGCIALRFELNFRRGAAAAAFSPDSRALTVAGAGPGAAVLPVEFRFTQGGQAGGDDFTVGDIEFNSAGGYQIAPNTDGGVSEDTAVNAQGVVAENNTGNAPPYITGAPGAQPASLLQNFSNQGSNGDGQNKGKGKGKGKNDHEAQTP